MTATRDYLMLDLGATSGRGVIGSFDGNTVNLKEINRFPNAPEKRNGHLHWNWPRIIQEIDDTLKAAHTCSSSICGVGCDSWGLDHGFIDETGALLEWPFAYQDIRTASCADEIEHVISAEKLIDRTAVPFIGFSTLGQLIATRKMRPDLLSKAASFLFIPGLVHHHLTGKVGTDYCGACPSALCDWQTRKWDDGLIESFGLPRHIFPDILPTGSKLDALSSNLAQQLEIPQWDVHIPAGHDTALAVAAAPWKAGDMVISSGTWSMLGVIVPNPIPGRHALPLGAGTYGIPGDRWVFMCGIMGLYLLRKLQQEENCMDATTMDKIEAAPAFQCLFDPSKPMFSQEDRFMDVLSRWLHTQNRQMPDHIATVARGILESLALYVNSSLEGIQRSIEQKIKRIVIVGGGAQNNLLNQFIANATGLSVIAGAPEATAMGNILVQAWGQGELKTADDIRAVAMRSWPLRCFEPEDQDTWEEASSIMLAEDIL